MDPHNNGLTKDLLCEYASLPKTTSRMDMERYGMSLRAPAEARPVLPGKATYGKKKKDDVDNARHGYHRDQKSAAATKTKQKQHVFLCESKTPMPTLEPDGARMSGGTPD